MSCSPLQEILSDIFLTYVGKRINPSEREQFFMRLGFDDNACDHWEFGARILDNTATCTIGLKEWRDNPLNKNIACDTNIKELKEWIFRALEECERKDLADNLRKSNKDIHRIIDELSIRVTKERMAFYACLEIHFDDYGWMKSLREKTKTDLESWLLAQSTIFWKYQELLHAFHEQNQIATKHEIEDKFSVKDIFEAGIHEEPMTKKSKNVQILQTKVSASTITGPRPSTSNESVNVIVTEESKTPEDMDIGSEFDLEAKDKNAECTNMETDSQKDQTNLPENEKNFVGKSDTSRITLRDYQQELEELALMGENTIICAGTNSGKTYIALHIIEMHLNENTNGTIAFLTRTNVLLEQQFELACKLLPRLTRNGKIRKWQAGEDVTSETFKNWVKTSSIIFVTPQSMCNFLEEESENSRVEINQFTLIVLDECHHTYGNTPYNGIMRHYRKLKYGEKPKPRPQILGLTASPGTNKAKDVTSAKEHVKLIMANLDVSKLSVVQTYTSSLLKHTSIPEKVKIQSTKRQKDPVKALLLQTMDDVEDVFDDELVTTFLRNSVNKTDTIQKAFFNPPKDRTTVRYLQWLGETKMKVEEITTSQPTIPRLLHACLRHLEFYAECLEINALLDIRNVRDAIQEGYIRLKEQSEKAIETKEKDLVKALEGVYSKIFDLGRRIERNPDIENVIKILEKEYDELADESRFLVFVKTRLTAKALAEKMPDHFNSRYLTGSQISKEEGGLSREEQADIVARFREGKHLCVVATSVAAEGLDIQKCTVVIRYRLIPNEISSVQMRGRVRQKGGKDVIVGSQEEFEKEDINVERLYLMQEATQLVLKEDIMDIMEAISTKERNIFQMEDQERKRQKLNPNEKNKGQFYVGCKKCSNNSFIIVDVQFIRRIKNTHSIVCDKAIFAMIERRKTKKSFDYDAIKKTDKVFGFECGHNWGSILIYQECEFVSLSQDYIQIIEKETQQPLSLKKWSDVDSQFPLDDITDDEMIKYRSQPTPPLPMAI